MRAAPSSKQRLTFAPSLILEVDLPEAVIVLTMTALNPFTGTVLSSVSGATGAAGDGVMGGRCEGVGVGVGGATAAAIITIFQERGHKMKHHMTRRTTALKQDIVFTSSR